MLYRTPQQHPHPAQPGPSSPTHQPPERWTHAQQAASEADRWTSGSGDPSQQHTQQHQDAGPNNRHADERDWWRRPDPAATVHNEPVRLLRAHNSVCPVAFMLLLALDYPALAKAYHDE